MKTILKTATHEIKCHDSATIGIPLEVSEREWRNSELARTDVIMSAGDYPSMPKLKTYRQELRDYPASEDFPNGVRPELTGK